MNVLIIEDELHTAALLRELIEKEEHYLVVQILGSIEESVRFLGQNQDHIDLIFMDIELEDGQSFEIFKHCEIHLPVIFCTAYDQYALKGIRNQGIDYILKPFHDLEIKETLDKYQNLLNRLAKTESKNYSFPNGTKSSYQTHFIALAKGKSQVVPVKDTALFYIDNETIFLHSFQNRKAAIQKKMENIETAVSPKQFFRVNRQYLVNRDAISSFEPYFNRSILLNLKVDHPIKVIVVRLKTKAFKEWIEIND